MILTYFHCVLCNLSISRTNLCPPRVMYFENRFSTIVYASDKTNLLGLDEEHIRYNMDLVQGL